MRLNGGPDAMTRRGPSDTRVAADGTATGKGGRPIVQFIHREGIIDLGWGHPDPDLLPVQSLRVAAGRVLQRYGADALNYGHAAGPGPFLEWVAERLAVVDGRAPDPAAIVASAGNSHALDQVVSLLAAPGDLVLVEDPTYHLAVRILRDHPVELVAVPADGAGLDTDALAEILASLRRSRRRPRLLYTVPTFHNPTGVSLAPDRRRALVNLASAEGFTIVEDDAYRELAYDGAPPPSLWSIAPEGVVVRLVSFSKSLAPGLRVGCIVADQSIARRIADSGVLDSGGGISHFASLIVAECGRSGVFAENVDRLRTAYRERRDALLTAVEHVVGPAASWVRPAGGYFVWLTLAGIEARALLAAAEARGTSFVPGDTFHLAQEHGRRSLRLGFSRYPPSQLAAAAARLADAIEAADPPG
jgi:2-aminoadipate transaminase